MDVRPQGRARLAEAVAHARPALIELVDRRVDVPRLDLDVEAAAREARALGARKVFLVGASIGGSAALAAAAATRPAVAGVVSVSGAADLVGALEAAKKLVVPALYIAGRFDPPFAADARRLYTATAARDRKLDIIGRGEHGTELVDASPRARSAIESFLRSH